MKNKKLWLGLVALIAAVAVLFGVYMAAKPETTQGSKTITVSVTHKDGSEKNFTYHTDEEYLGPCLLAEGLVEGENGSFGLMITTVDGETADWNADQSYWALYIGQEYASTGADTTPVNDGDSFGLVYTIG